MLALREIERRLGVADRLAACLDDPRNPDGVRHSLAEIIRFRMLMIAAGYEDGNDAAMLRHDPAFKLALDRLPDAAALCSQPTISRLENLPDLRALLRMGRAMVALYCASFRQVPRRIVLDLDDNFDAVHGGQQLRLFNAYHDAYGFQPLVVFDGDGRPVAAMLRPARRPTGAEARGCLRRLVREIRSHWPRVEILIHADSYFCAPGVLDFCRVARIDFVLGVATGQDLALASATSFRHVICLTFVCVSAAPNIVAALSEGSATFREPAVLDGAQRPTQVEFAALIVCIGEIWRHGQRKTLILPLSCELIIF